MKMSNKSAAKVEQGFTLVELLIVVAIIGILAAVATPMYQDYTRDAKLVELDTFAAKYKNEVMICYHTEGRLDDCDNGSNGVSATVAVGNVASVTVTNGVIAVKSVAGLASDGTKAVKRTYTPTANSNGILWAVAEVEE